MKTKHQEKVKTSKSISTTFKKRLEQEGASDSLLLEIAEASEVYPELTELLNDFQEVSGETIPSEAKQESLRLVKKLVSNSFIPTFQRIAVPVFMQMFAQIKHSYLVENPSPEYSGNKKMFVICGSPGAGKTVFVHKILKPFQDQTIHTTSSVLMNRNTPDKRVYFMDELTFPANSIRSRLGPAFRRFITAPFLDEPRGRRSIRTTIVATSNTYPFAASFLKRRLIQIPVLDRMNWEAVNSTDMKALLRGIDPFKDYLAPIKRELEVYQSLDHRCELISDFLTKTGINFKEKEVKTSIASLYRLFREHLRANHNDPGSLVKPVFQATLEDDLGIPVRSSGGRKYVWTNDFSGT